MSRIGTAPLAAGPLTEAERSELDAFVTAHREGNGFWRVYAAAVTRFLAAHDHEKSRAERAERALWDIVNPVEGMRRRLKEGERLDGIWAARLAEDVGYLRGIADDALKGVDRD